MPGLDWSQARPYPCRMSNHAPAMTIDRAQTADDLLTALYAIPAERRALALQGRTGSAYRLMLQEAADLCGVAYADDMSRSQAIRAIVENF